MARKKNGDDNNTFDAVSYLRKLTVIPQYHPDAILPFNFFSFIVVDS